MIYTTNRTVYIDFWRPTPQVRRHCILWRMSFDTRILDYYSVEHIPNIKYN